VRPVTDVSSEESLFMPIRTPAPPPRLDLDLLLSAEQPVYEIFRYLTSLNGVHDGTAVVDALPPPLRWIWATFLLDADVRNGGFHQYFYNSSRLWVDDAIQGFREMGLPTHASLVDRAAMLAIDPREAEVRRQARTAGTAKAFSESYEHTELGPLDREYYALPGWTPAVDTYVREHAEAFVHP
jgi:hypothetical protein